MSFNHVELSRSISKVLPGYHDMFLVHVSWNAVGAKTRIKYNTKKNRTKTHQIRHEISPSSDLEIQFYIPLLFREYYEW